jgi:hypothetical protein
MHAQRCPAQFKAVVAVHARGYASVLDAHLHVSANKLQLLSLKEGNGQSLGKFVCSFQESGTFKGVTIKKNDSNEAEFVKLRNQFSRHSTITFLHAFQPMV